MCKTKAEGGRCNGWLNSRYSDLNNRVSSGKLNDKELKRCDDEMKKIATTMLERELKFPKKFNPNTLGKNVEKTRKYIEMAEKLGNSQEVCGAMAKLGEYSKNALTPLEPIDRANRLNIPDRKERFEKRTAEMKDLISSVRSTDTKPNVEYDKSVTKAFKSECETVLSVFPNEWKNTDEIPLGIGNTTGRSYLRTSEIFFEKNVREGDRLDIVRKGGITEGLLDHVEANADRFNMKGVLNKELNRQYCRHKMDIEEIEFDKNGHIDSIKYTTYQQGLLSKDLLNNPMVSHVEGKRKNSYIGRLYDADEEGESQLDCLAKIDFREKRSYNSYATTSHELTHFAEKFGANKYAVDYLKNRAIQNGNEILSQRPLGDGCTARECYILDTGFEDNYQAKFYQDQKYGDGTEVLSMASESLIAGGFNHDEDAENFLLGLMLTK